MEHDRDQAVENMKIPDITRLFKGAKNEFEVEVVFGEIGNRSPEESHTFVEIIIVASGAINLERSDEDETGRFKPFDSVVIPAGVEHVIVPTETPTRLVIIHPDRQ